MTTTPARDALYAALTTGVQHAQLRQHLIDAALAEDRAARATQAATLADRRERYTAAITAEHYRRAEARVVANPEEHSAAMADVVLAADQDHDAEVRAAAFNEAADAVQTHPGPIPYRPQLDEDGGFWWDTRDRDAITDLLRRMAAAARPDNTGEEARP